MSRRVSQMSINYTKCSEVIFEPVYECQLINLKFYFYQ